MRYRLAVFDFDGTLADSFPWFLRVVNDAADRYRFRRIEPDEVDALRGWDPRRLNAHLGIPAWKLPLVATYLRRRMAGEIDGISLFPGVPRMLRALSDAGVAVAVVTSNAQDNVARVLGPHAAHVGHYGCGASLFGKRAKLREVLRATGIPAAEAIGIGDEIRDLQAARAEGMAFGGVTWGYAHADALRAHAPDALFASVDEIAAALAGGGESGR